MVYKRAFRIFIFIIIANNCQGQSKNVMDTAVYKALYSFEYIKDTNKLSFTMYQENMALYIGKSNSSYRSDQYESIAVRREEFKTALAAQKNAGGNINFQAPNSTGANPSPEEIINAGFTDLRIRIIMPENAIYFNDSTTRINWTIADDTARIGTFLCSKAYGVFRGRKYTAWFAPQIPISAGPWKLAGLPGLILEAVDSSQTIKFRFLSFENTSFSPKSIVNVKSESDKQILKTDYRKMVAAMASDPIKYIETLAASRGIKMTLSTINGLPAENFKRAKNKNPMEISEK